MAKYTVFIDEPKLVIKIEAECVSENGNTIEFTKADGTLFKKSWVRAGKIVALIHEDVEA